VALRLTYKVKPRFRATRDCLKHRSGNELRLKEIPIQVFVLTRLSTRTSVYLQLGPFFGAPPKVHVKLTLCLVYLVIRATLIEFKNIAKLGPPESGKCGEKITGGQAVSLHALFFSPFFPSGMT